MFLDKVYAIFLRLFLLVFPVGTVLLFSVPVVAGTNWDMGTLRLYATEVCVWFLLFVYIRQSVVPLVRARHIRFVAQPFRVWIICAVLFLCVQYVVSFNASLAAQTVRMMVSTLVCAVLVYRECRRDPRLWQYVAIGSLPVFVFGIFEWGMQTTWSSTLFGLAEHAPYVPGTSVIVEAVGGRFLRAYSVFPHPNIFGGYATLLLCMLLRIRPITWQQAVLGAAGTTLGSVALLVSWSRSAWLALACGVVVLILQKQILWHRVVPIVLVGIIGAVIYAPLIHTRTAVTSPAETRSVVERRDGILSALQEVNLSRPFGVGLGNYTVLLHKKNLDASGYSLQPVHVVPLIALVELGWLGVLAWGVVVWKFISKIRVRFDQRHILLFVVFAPLLCFDHYVWTTYQGMLMTAVFVALILGFPQVFPTSSTDRRSL